MISTFQAILLGIVEGLTEFLPISSTAHLIVTEYLLNIKPSDYLNFYTVFIQLGAISAVCLLYFKRLTTNIILYKYIIISFIPAVIFGVLLDDFLESLFQGYWFIAFSWIIGGFILIFIDSWIKKTNESNNTIEDITSIQSLKIGLFQCLAMIPGVSRSGASIIGGRIVGLNHKNAVEYSFLLGVPTILGASAKKMLDYKSNLAEFLVGENLLMLSLSFIISLIVALITIRFMVNIVNKYGFKYFGYYRICIGITLAFFLWWN